MIPSIGGGPLRLGIIFGHVGPQGWYARVSTQGQTLEAQLEQLTEAGCEAIYKEIASGARSDREQLKTLLKGLQPGSTLVVTRLDRLARSTVDLLTTIKAIADKGCR
jgi:DNA invertase Pin-like site-specific DNA recombinase